MKNTLTNIVKLFDILELKSTYWSTLLTIKAEILLKIPIVAPKIIKTDVDPWKLSQYYLQLNLTYFTGLNIPERPS